MNPGNERFVSLDGVERKANYEKSFNASLERFSNDDWPEDFEVSALDIQVGGGHYKDMAIQPMEYCQKNNLGAAESFVVKYVSRHKSKNGAEDIKKAIHCLQLLLQIDYKESV
jgi:hypothetical protein